MEHTNIQQTYIILNINYLLQQLSFSLFINSLNKDLFIWPSTNEDLIVLVYFEVGDLSFMFLESAMEFPWVVAENVEVAIVVGHNDLFELVDAPESGDFIIWVLEDAWVDFGGFASEHVDEPDVLGSGHDDLVGDFVELTSNRS